MQHFCDECDSYMSLKNKSLCCDRCGFEKEYTNNDDKHISFNRKDYILELLKLNDHIKKDKTLPIIDGNANLKCINGECPSNTNPDIKSQSKYIKYDKDNIYFIYICMNCNHVWSNNLDD